MATQRTEENGSGPPGHEDRLRRAFERQVGRYDEFTAGQTDILTWIVNELPVAAHSRVLDVAAGTGQLSAVLAEVAGHVLALDLTAAMLTQAVSRRNERGLTNLDICMGRAEALPVAGGSFDLVTCRLGIHHMAAPVSAVAEIARACAPGGCVAIVDLVAPDDELAERYNHLERLRDPSHVRARPLAELTELLADAGLVRGRTVSRDVEVDLERWLDVTRPPTADADSIRRTLRAELAGGPTTGMRPFEIDGSLGFRQTWAIALGTKP